MASDPIDDTPIDDTGNDITASLTGMAPLHAWSPRRAALLVIDLQNGSMRPDCGYGRFYRAIGRDDLVAHRQARVPVLLAHVRALLDAFRAHGAPVIFTTISYARDFSDLPRRWHGRLRACREAGIAPPFAVHGSWEERIVDELAPRPGEPVLRKSTAGAFAGTELLPILRERGIDTLAVAGVATNYCVESTVREAADRDLLCAVVADATDTTSAARQQAALHSLEAYALVVDTPAVIAWISDRSEGRGGVGQ